jgi:hypothetical protein
MNLFKDERTLRLDDFDLAATEALELGRDLAERIEDAALQALVADHVASQSALLRQIDDVRRAQGDLPQAGDPERAHLGAAGAHLRAIMLPGDTTVHYVETLQNAAAKVSTELDGALATELSASLECLFAEFKQAHDAFESALRRFA